MAASGHERAITGVRLARSSTPRLLLHGRNPFGRLRFRQGVIHGFARFVTERFQVRALRGRHGLVPRRPFFEDLSARYRPLYRSEEDSAGD